MTPQVFFYDVKCCRNCLFGLKHKGRQTCKNNSVIQFLKDGKDPQISIIDGVERAFVFDHKSCNFYQFRNAQIKHQYIRTKALAKDYFDVVERNVLDEEQKRTTQEVVEKYGIILQGRHR